MFLHRLSSVTSSFRPCSRPAVSWAGFRSSSASSFSSSSSSSSHPSHLPRFTPAPRPWWSVRGFPPWPPRSPRSPSIRPGDAGASLHTSAGCRMDRPDRGREPPHKRRKSLEEKRRSEGDEAKEGGFRREQQGNVWTNQRHRDGHRDRGRNGAENRDKDVERTKTGVKDRQRKDSSSREDGFRSQSRSEQEEARGGGSRTRIKEQETLQKPNPWFKGRSSEEHGGTRGGAAGRPRDSREDGGRRTSFPLPPHGAVRPPNPWQGANREPPPPGVPPLVTSLQRRWESCSTDLQPPGGGAAFDFSVMTYNILSQDLLQDNAYLYRHCPPDVLAWEHRLPNLLAEIQGHEADILCLQEVQEDHYENQIRPALRALGYECEYKKRTGKKPDGCAVGFKTSRFSLLSSNPVEFLRRGDVLLDRDNVGLVVLLRPRDASSSSSSSSFVCVANTHLLYNPRRGDIKLAQLAILLAEIRRLSLLPDGSTNPVLLCGDFNSTPWSPLYSFLTTGRLEYRGMQISRVSGQEDSPRGQRLLTSPIWSHSLGINRRCQYEATSGASACGAEAVEGAISDMTVEDLTSRASAAAAFNRERIEHSLKLQSSYRHRLRSDGRPEITTYHSRTALTVDYILYSPDHSAPPSLPGGRGLQLLGRLSLVGQSELEELGGLPSRRHSSDHLPLLARFRLRL
ncbi:protein angel homolog 2 isoform X2 [Mugil cephalus]|nr:protein angel homolog 2 isoform X2 [Mugil cephalus]